MISAVTTFHREGYLAQITLNSIERCRDYCEQRGLKVELVFVLDRADALTNKLVREHSCVKAGDVLIEASNGDLGLSRNLGISKAGGEFIAILDGDDLYSESWLFDSVEFIKARGNHIICHPEMVVNFGMYNSYCQQVDQESEEFDVDGLFATNFWTAWVVAHRDVFQQVEYAKSDHLTSGFGHEDWHWNCETIHRGYIHKLVPETCGFYRRKTVSLLSEQLSKRVHIRKTSLFAKSEK
ncbi:glycosyltransferase family 2 protein [Microbulbifer agarilyticus]|uniref:glycosyltransferase n=1 Tax=Microbulbifer agarilyticus TaxID=260552 RepID=UPI001C95421F|nr:glycosyltransferase [Microbulbifer agarilyticus]MBY6189164.1 glycosyltransferase family 2 protein [Microbulbifer agarilyticus]